MRMSVSIALVGTNPAELAAGDVLDGVVVVESEADFSHNGIVVSLARAENCQWSELDSGENMIFQGRACVEQQVMLGPRGVLGPGRHVFPFRLRLRDELCACTFARSDNFTASLGYTLQAEALRSLLRTSARSTELELGTAARPTPDMFAAVTSSQTRQFLCYEGAVFMQVQLPRAVAVPTEQLQPRVVISNVSPVLVESLTVRLVQVVKLRGIAARTGATRSSSGAGLQAITLRKVVAEHVLAGVPAGASCDRLVTIAMPPDAACASTGDCLVLHHELVVECNLALALDVSVACALYVFPAFVFYAPPPAPLPAAVHDAFLATGPLAVQCPAAAMSSELACPPDACHHLWLFAPTQPHNESVGYAKNKMYFMDVTAVADQDARVVVTATGSVTLHVARGAPPGLLTGYEASSHASGANDHVLILDASSTPPLAVGRYFVGVFGQSLLPPISKYTLSCSLHHVQIVPWQSNGSRTDRDAADGAPEQASAALEPSTPTHPDYAPPRYKAALRMPSFAESDQADA